MLKISKLNKLKTNLVFLWKKQNWQNKVFFLYLLTLFIFWVYLLFPWNWEKEKNIDFLNKIKIIIFTSTSAFSTTGLTINNINEIFSIFGLITILFLIQIGGLGIFTIKWIIFSFLLNNKLNYQEVLFVQKEKGLTKLKNTKEIIKISIFFIILIEIIGTIFLTIFFQQNEKFHANENSYASHFFKTIFFAFFHTISAINNCGLTITNNISLYDYKNDYFILTAIMALFIIGGIGFPIFREIYLNLTKKKKINFSLFTKLSTITYLFISILGFFLIFLFEKVYTNNNNKWTLGDIIFNSMSAKSAGFYTKNFDELQNPSLIIIMLIMWIGTSPVSTGGGIRTTTIAIVIISIYKFIKNQDRKINIFKRSLSSENVLNAFVVVFISLILIIITYLIISFSQNNSNSLHVFFIVFSAFGTSGLISEQSNHLLNDFGFISLTMLICLMFIGQIGITSAFLSWKNKKISKIRYIREKINI